MKHTEKNVCVCVCGVGFFLGGGTQRPSRCVVTNLYNVLYSVNTQLRISTVILYIHSGHIMATCFERKRASSGQ